MRVAPMCLDLQVISHIILDQVKRYCTVSSLRQARLCQREDPSTEDPSPGDPFSPGSPPQLTEALPASPLRSDPPQRQPSAQPAAGPRLVPWPAQSSSDARTLWQDAGKEAGPPSKRRAVEQQDSACKPAAGAGCARPACTQCQKDLVAAEQTGAHQPAPPSSRVSGRAPPAADMACTDPQPAPTMGGLSSRPPVWAQLQAGPEEPTRSSFSSQSQLQLTQGLTPRGSPQGSLCPAAPAHTSQLAPAEPPPSARLSDSLLDLPVPQGSAQLARPPGAGSGLGPSVSPAAKPVSDSSLPVLHHREEHAVPHDTPAGPQLFSGASGSSHMPAAAPLPEAASSEGGSLAGSPVDIPPPLNDPNFAPLLEELLSWR